VDARGSGHRCKKFCQLLDVPVHYRAGLGGETASGSIFLSGGGKKIITLSQNKGEPPLAKKQLRGKFWHLWDPLLTSNSLLVDV